MRGEDQNSKGLEMNVKYRSAFKSFNEWKVEETEKRLATNFSNSKYMISKKTYRETGKERGLDPSMKMMEK
jgi:hypothetical protein